MTPEEGKLLRLHLVTTFSEVSMVLREMRVCMGQILGTMSQIRPDAVNVDYFDEVADRFSRIKELAELLDKLDAISDRFGDEPYMGGPA